MPPLHGNKSYLNFGVTYKILSWAGDRSIKRIHRYARTNFYDPRTQ